MLSKHVNKFGSQNHIFHKHGKLMLIEQLKNINRGLKAKPEI